MTDGGIHRRYEDGSLEEVLPRRRGIGGLAPHARGGIVCTGRDVAWARDGELHTLLAAPEGVSGFNDLHVEPGGGVLVGALRFAPFRGEEPVPSEVWRIAPDGSASVAVTGPRWPNGIGRTAGGGVLYVNDYADEVVLAYGGGELRTFARAPRGSCDGLAVDGEGGVWVALGTGAAIARFGEDGALDALLDVPTDFASSLAFGGDDGRDLYVTAYGAIFVTRVQIAGQPVPLAGIESIGTHDPEVT